MGTTGKSHRPPTIHLSKKQAYPIIEQYFRSGMLPWEKVGWSDNQFYNWRKRYMEEHHLLPEASGQAEFHPVSVPAPDSRPDGLPAKPSETGTATEIIYPNGVVLRTSSIDPGIWPT